MQKVAILREEQAGRADAPYFARHGPRALAAALARGEPFFDLKAEPLSRSRIPPRDCERLLAAGVDGACVYVLEPADGEALGFTRWQWARVMRVAETLRAGPGAREEEAAAAAAVRGVREWTEADVARWLNESHLAAESGLAQRFEAECVDGATLLSLAEAKDRGEVLGLESGSLLDHRFARRLEWLVEGRRDVPVEVTWGPQQLRDFLASLPKGKPSKKAFEALRDKGVDGACVELLLDKDSCAKRLVILSKKLRERHNKWTKSGTESAREVGRPSCGS
jgi:hypothetical protein